MAETGPNINNDLFSLETHNGHAILIDPNLNTSMIGQLFYYKFKQAYTDVVASFVRGNLILCSVRIGEKYYPVTFDLIQGTSPPHPRKRLLHSI